MKPKAIIFDLWETLGAKNFSVSKQLQQVLSIEKTPDYMVRYERAVQTQAWQSPQQLAESFLAEFNLEKNQKNLEYVAAVFSTSVENVTLFDGISELLQLYKAKGYQLGLLSNTTIFESNVVKKLGITELFDATAYSWQNGQLKPAAAAFANILEKLNVSASEAVFVDDSPVNTAAAEKIGMQAITFESVPALKIALGKIFSEN